ncbi:acyltransferase [Lithospermum erythrorhizon]|uniref:Acyltransferase n=1 Tax=Lithospermum erythrorhizon TaxID=34254 RepID=A0AAV3Q7H2_LITER
MEGDILEVIKYWLEGEITNFIKVWLITYTSITYCYFASKIIPKGKSRLLAFLPIISLFIYLPFTLHSTHLGGTTTFFITWLTNFKLLMFTYNVGPLADPSITTLFHFVAIACLPIKIIEKNNPIDDSIQKGKKSTLHYAIKVLFMAMFLKVYDYTNLIHPRIIMFIYSIHTYLLLEIILVICASLARGLLNVEVEPQFQEPFLSTSLQDFWGRRWNLMVTRILKPSVYIPVLKSSERFLGRSYSQLLAIFATFAVSAAMHELIFYQMGRLKPNWGITLFFLMHGVCLVLEVGAKKVLGVKIQFPGILGRVFTVAFVMGTGFWLFFPQLVRVKAFERGLGEYAAIGAFFKDIAKALNLSTFQTQ